MTREYFHSKEYVVKYIKRHMEKGHGLSDVLEHIRPHVHTDVLEKALAEVHLSDYAPQMETKILHVEPKEFSSSPFVHQKEEHIDFSDVMSEHDTQPEDDVGLLSQFRVYEYVLVVILFVFLILGMEQSLYMVILFFLCLLWTGLAWSGYFSSARNGLLVTFLVSIVLLYIDGSIALAVTSGFLLLSVYFSLYLGKMSRAKEARAAS